MRDELFIRGNLPMTKSEVRAVSLSKLELKKGSVFWDIGAGTGSVAVEGARYLNRLGDPVGSVYAIEQNPEGIRLIGENQKKWIPEGSHFYLIQGHAPDVLEQLPPPTHVFIGGSGGCLKKILETVWKRNPSARIVANAVTAETLAVLMEVVLEYPLDFYEIVQVAVSRMEKMGCYHLQKGENPVFVITLQGKTIGENER